MRTLVLLFLLLVGVLSSNAQVRIGNTQIPYNTAWEYFGMWGRAPGSNMVENINPPMFNWLYYEEANLINLTTETRVFNFQLTTNGSFASPLWNYTVSNNFWNFFPCITNADGSTWTGDVSWRIRYYNSNLTVLKATSPAWTFRMPSDAKKFDRSMFANKDWLNSWSNKHPRIMVHGPGGVLPSNVQEIRDFVHGPNLNATIGSVTLGHYTNSIGIIGGPLWCTTTNQLMTNVGFPTFHWAFLAGGIADLGFCLWGITNAGVTNAILSASPSVVDVLTNWAAANRVQGYDRLEAYGGNFYGIEALANAYDTLFHLMNQEQRDYLGDIMDDWAAFYVFEDLYFRGSTPNTDYVYGNRPLQVGRPSMFHDVESHQRSDRLFLHLVLARFGDSDMANHLLEYGLNFYLARFDNYNYSGEDPRIYGGISTILDYSRSFSPWVAANMTFQGLGLTNAPIYNEMADVIMFDAPTGFRSMHNSWGQVSCYCENMFATQGNPWQYAAFSVFAGMFGRPDVQRQHMRSSDVTSFGTGRAYEAHGFQAIATSPVYWPVPAEADRNTNSFVDAKRGFAIGLSGKPTDWDIFTNGLGFVFQARPNGAGRNSGGMFSDGQVELWAYGAGLTAAGGGYFAQGALRHNGVFVDGIGANTAHPSVTFPVHGYFEAETNFSKGFYVRGNLTHVMNISNYWGGGVGNEQSTPNSSALVSYMSPSNARPYISNITRSVTFFTNGGLTVIRDNFTTTQSAHFQFKWNAYPTNATFDAPTMSLRYTLTNLYQGRPNVSVLLKKLRDASTISYLHLKNDTNPTGMEYECYALWNPYTGEKYSGTNDWRNGHIPTDTLRYWASTIWTENKTPATEWTDATAIAPQKGDTNEWTLIAIDADRLAATNLTLAIPFAEFISYNTNDLPGGSGEYAGIATVVIDEGVTVASTPNTNPPTSIVFEAAIPGNQQVALTWSASTLQDGYYLGYYTNGGTTNFVSYSAAATGGTVSSLVNNTEYLFRLIATNVYGTSSTATTNATPSVTASHPGADATTLVPARAAVINAGGLR